MTGVLLRTGGAVLVVLVLADVVATTLTIGTGAGPLTRRVLGPAWRVLLWLHRTDSTSAWLSTAGTVLLMSTVLLWVALLTALLGGSILLNVFKEEIPSGRRTSFGWFLTGLVLYAGLLAAVTAVSE